MIIIDYQAKFHKRIIHACVAALRAGKVVVYPTDTSYGLAVNIDNARAVEKLYRVKERGFNKPSSVIAPSISYAKRMVEWDRTATKLVKKFWPGAVTILVKLKMKNEKLKVLTANSGFIGLRMPENKIALDLAKILGRPITATSANVAGVEDCYSAEDVIKQFKKKKFKPDIIINAGKLPKRKPSTIVKIANNNFEILRHGPVSEQQIKTALK